MKEKKIQRLRKSREGIMEDSKAERRQTAQWHSNVIEKEKTDKRRNKE